ncbi:MAG: bifunctional riboflavin kinase/FAD synthetase [Neisseriaceae bacterium]
MQIYYGIDPPLPRLMGSAVTIGNFDGVHCGHRQLLQILRQTAQTSKLPSVLITFEPLSKEYFSTLHPDRYDCPVRISPLKDKLSIIADSGLVDIVIVLNFDANLARMTAESFVKLVLLTQLNTRYLILGADFKFGHDRRGDYHYLSQFSQFKTICLPSLFVSGIRVSSSVIRATLLKGDFKQAELFLGHSYSLSGIVKHGLKLGRKLGCPTANIDLQQRRFPLQGIYVVEVEGKFGQRRGVASFGTNPTISDDPSLKFEVHLLDFNDDLYGQTLKITFKAKIRDELKFANLEQLKKQLTKDIQAAKTWSARP